MRGLTALGLGTATADVAVVVGSSSCTAPPQAPTGLRADDLGGGQLRVSWDAPSGPPPTDYVLEASAGTGGAKIASVVVTTTSQTFGGVPPGAFLLRVRARNACGVSTPGADVLVGMGGAPTPPLAPLGLVGAATGGSVTIQWQPSPSVTASSYRLEAGTQFGANDLAVVPVAGTSFSAGGIPPGVYYLRVRAVGVAGAGPASNELVLRVP